MKPRYRLFRRENGLYYSLDVETDRRESLQIPDIHDARKLLSSKNEACRQPAMNLEIARVYLHHGDPSYASRTWQQVMDEMARHKKGKHKSVGNGP